MCRNSPCVPPHEACAFLSMVGLVLVAEGFGAQIGEGFIYGSMGFSIFVEMINI